MFLCLISSFDVWSRTRKREEMINGIKERRMKVDKNDMKHPLFFPLSTVQWCKAMSNICLFWDDLYMNPCLHSTFLCLIAYRCCFHTSLTINNGRVASAWATHENGQMNNPPGPLNTCRKNIQNPKQTTVTPPTPIAYVHTNLDICIHHPSLTQFALNSAC